MDRQILLPNRQWTGECDFGAVVEIIFRESHTIGGFENFQHCWIRKRPPIQIDPHDAISVQADTWRDVLTQLCSDAGFEWRDVQGTVVVRPKGAWDDPHDVLHNSVASLTLEAPPIDLVRSLLRMTRPSMYLPFQRIDEPKSIVDRPVQLRFRGGTLLDAFVTLANAHGAIGWSLGYADSTSGTLLIYALESRTEVVAIPMKISR